MCHIKVKDCVKDRVKYVYISFLQKCSPDMKNAAYVITSKLQKELKRGNPSSEDAHDPEGTAIS